MQLDSGDKEGTDVDAVPCVGASLGSQLDLDSVTPPVEDVLQPAAVTASQGEAC